MTLRPAPRSFPISLLALVVTAHALSGAGAVPGAAGREPDGGRSPAVTPAAVGAKAAAAVQRSPLAFEPLLDGDGLTRYRAHGPGYVLDVLPGEVRVATRRGPSARGPERGRRSPADTDSGLDVTRMVLAGAQSARLRGEAPLGSVAHQFVGGDPSRWRTGVPHSGRVVADGVYPGIDLVYYGNQGRLQYDFVVGAGADPSAIALAFPDATSLRLADNGDLHVERHGAAPLVQHAPVVYQDIDGTRHAVEGRFVLDAAARTVRFDVGAYDPAHALVIDPVLEYGTYFGAVSPATGASTQPASVGVDGAGNMYIAGRSDGALPLPQGGNTGLPAAGDAFIAKFSPAGQLLYTTRYGGDGDDRVRDIAVTPGGEVVIVGDTFSAGLPGSTAPGVYDATLTGDSDGFVARFDTSGVPVWATYVGGGSGGQFDVEHEAIARVVLEPTGGILVAGTMLDIGTLNGLDPTFNPGDTPEFTPPDGFVARFSPSGALLEATYLGTSTFDQVASLAVWPGGAVFVAGSTGSTFRGDYGLGATGAYQPVCQVADGGEGGDGGCAFVARLAPDLRSIYSATFLGPQYDVWLDDIAADADGSVLLTGYMWNAPVPATAGAYQTTAGGFSDAFVARMSGSLAQLDALTYLGGDDSDFGHSIRVDAAGRVHVAGVTYSRTFPLEPGALKSDFDGSADAFLARFTPSLGGATFLSRIGGVDEETFARSVPGRRGEAYLVGVTGPRTFGEEFSSATVPTTQGAFRTSRSPDATEAFLYRIGGDENGPVISAISPSGSGVPAAGSAVTILGSNFQAGAQVRVGGLPAAIVERTPTAIGAIVPAGLGASPDVAVTNPDGRSAFLVDPFNRVSFAGARVGDQVFGLLGYSTGNVVSPALSRDGRWLAFHTGTPMMVPGDTNGVADVFVRDRGASGAPVIVRVSVDSNGGQANGPSTRAKISANGRYVAFVSSATNLVPDDTNGAEDVFVHDRDADGNGVYDETFPGARATFRVSVASTGAQGTGGPGVLCPDIPDCSPLDLSPDGFWVAFTSYATNLVPGDTNGVRDVFLHHWPSGQTKRVSVATGGGQANGHSDSPGVSAGGRRVVFASYADNLVPNDGNSARDVFLFDRDDRTTTRVSTAHGSTADANGHSALPSIDDRGGTIVFQTRATNILPASARLSGSTWQVVVLRLPALTPFDALRSGAGLAMVGQPVVNIADAIRNLISGNAQGQPGSGNSGNAAVNGDGTGVSFDSDAGDLVLGDSNGQNDAFVASTGGGPEIVSVTEDGQQGGKPSQQAVLSDDGTTVAFQSQAPLTPAVENQPTPNLTNVFVRGNALLLTALAPQSGPTGGVQVTITGANFGATPASVRFGGVSAAIQSWTTSEIRVQAPAAVQAGAVNVTVTSASGETQTAVNGFTYLAAGGDADLDGLPDSWEAQFGLDPNSAAGVNGAGGDPDGDGLTNAEEFARGTHPRGTFQRFLAEGATNDFFTTRISLANPSETQAAIVLLRFQRTDGTEVRSLVTLPPLQSRKVVVNQVPNMASAEFATLVESDALVVVDRQMWWNSADAYGTHAEGAVKAPSLVWYLAEGATHSGFDLFYLLQNPSPTPATVKVRYLLPTGAPIEKVYIVGPNSRKNIWVDNEQFPDGSGNFALGNTDVSAVLEVTNNVPIIVERAMYLTRGSELFSAGHESAGVNAPALTWFLAEGATGPFFDLFVLLANPNATDATAKVTYLLEDGRTFTQTVVVKANSRRNLWVDLEQPDGTTGFPLADAALSTKVEVTNGVPIIVERAMWWPGEWTQWYEAHNSPGSVVTGTLWGLADGVVTAPPSSTATYILVANTETAPAATATVRVTLLFDGSATESKEFTVPANSRKTIDVGWEFQLAPGREFGALVESVAAGGAAPPQIVVERALYNNARGLFWGGGNNQLATRLR